MKKKWNIVGLLLAVFVAMILMTVSARAQEAIPYAVFSQSDSTLTFHYDTNKPDDAFGMDLIWNFGYKPEWHAISGGIAKIIIEPSFANYKPTSCEQWFSCYNLREIKGLQYLNTEKVTNMYYMFGGCANLTSLDLSSFNTENVEDMSYMFIGCSSLESLNVSSFNTKRVTNMYKMFGCGTFGWDCDYFFTHKGARSCPYDGGQKLYGLYALTNLDLSSFNTENVTDMGCMFGGCTALKTLILTNFNTKCVTNMEYMFRNCSNLTSLDLSAFNTENVTNMHGMFEGCRSLKSLDLSSFDTKNVTNMHVMFAECGSMADIKISGLNTAKVTDMSNMFGGCSNLKLLDLSSFNTKNVSDMSGMFGDCISLATIYIGDEWSNASVEKSDEMFGNCKKLVGEKGTRCIYGENNIYAKIDGGKATPGYFTRNGNVPFKLLLPYAIFNDGMLTLGYNLQKIPDDAVEIDDVIATYYSGDESDFYYSNFIASNITSSENVKKIVIDKSFADYLPVTCAFWFANCSNLKTIEGLENINTTNVENMYGMFANCPKLITIFADDNWKTNSVKRSEYMFYECRKLYGGNGTHCEDDDIKFAKIDEGKDSPGYFTKTGESAFYPMEAYAVLQDGILTIRYATNAPEDAYDIENGELDWSAEWKKNVKKVVFEKSFSAYRPTYCAGWFADCINLTEIDGIQYLNTENVTNMWGMFYGCSSLTTLDLSKFKTEKVTFMYSMFKYCDNLTNLDLGNFNTNNVTDMSYMFNDCSSLTNLDLSSFNTKNVTDISAMFEGCKNLADLNMSNFNTQNVTNMMGMFSGCSSLTTLDLSSFDTEKAELRDMFTGCSNLTTIFAGDKWSTKSVYVGIAEDDEWGNEEVYITGDMFAGCTSLVGGKGTKFDENNITYTYAHIDGGKGNPGYLTAVEIVSISVTTLPKTTYLEGEDLNLDGGIVSVNYNNGSIETADLAKAEISGFDKNKSGEQTLIVKYMGKETSFIVTVKSPTPYATFANGTLTLGYGSDIPNDATKISGEVIPSLSKSTSSNYIASNITAAKNVQKVVFDKTFADYQPENCAYWFNGCNNLTGIDGMENLDTKNTTDMTAMFQNCEKLACLDLSGFNTTKVSDMSKMFNNCTELATIFVGDTWNMSNVQKSQDMFLNCQKLVGGNGTKYDANHSDEDFAKIDGKNSGYFTKAGQEPYKVAEPYAVFDNGTLTFYYDGNKPDGAFEMRTSKDDGWTSVASEIIKVVFDNSFADYRPTSCEYWFFNCSNLTKIEGIKNLNTEDVTSIRSMFNRCEKLESIDLSSFNTQNVTNMRYAFYGCTNLKTLDLSKFNTEKVTTMKSMFCYCNNLKTLDLSSFNTKNVTDMSYMLDSCVNLKTVDLNSFNTKNVTNMYAMFAYCYNLSTIDLSNFDTRNVTNMHGVFYKCTNLKTIDVSGFDTKNVTDMGFLFSNCEKLQNIDLSNFDTRNVTNMRAMFQSCVSLQNLDLSSFNTKNVTDMSYMFTLCSSLNTIYVGDDWSTSSVTESKKMFPQCAALVGGKGTTFNSDKIDKTYARIDGGKDNPGYFTKSGEKPYEEPTPVSEIIPAKDNIDIWSFEKTIFIQNPSKEIRIVDMSGRLVKTVKATADRMEIPMQKSGIYIVKTGAKTRKVMIQ